MTFLDLGTKILAAAYQHVGLAMPDWLKTRRLPQNQMESSFVDSMVAIKNAFETLINVNLKNFNKLDKFEESDIKQSVANRVANLLDGRMLPYIKRSSSDDNKVLINTGILAELYKYGVTRDQLPNLKALADVMGGTNTQAKLSTMKYHRFSRRRKKSFYSMHWYFKYRKKSDYMINTVRSKMLDSGFFENQVWGALHKAWKGYTIAKKKGEDDKMELYARRVQELQNDLGLPISSFDDIGMSATGFLWELVQKEDNDKQR